MARKKQWTPYTLSERALLRARVAKLTSSDWHTEWIVAVLDARHVNPHVAQLPKFLAKKRIWPPPHDHSPSAKCRCLVCRGIRSFPWYYVGGVCRMSYEDYIDKQAIAEGAMEEGLKEEIEARRGKSPGVVVDARRRKDEARRKAG